MMQLIPVQTRRLDPPQDDLFVVLDEALVDVQEGDLILVTSKVVAIHQGRCRSLSTNKLKLVAAEAEHWIEGHTKYSQSPLSIKYAALFYAAGIDESNSGGYYTLLPDKPYEAAKEIWQYLRERHNLQNLGVIITDSHSQPLRWGVSSISIGFWGFYPLDSHVGKRDLFGRDVKLSITNIADSVSAGASLVSGETNESTPIVVARNVPNLRYTATDRREDLIVDPQDDLFYPLLKPFYNQTQM